MVLPINHSKYGTTTKDSAGAQRDKYNNSYLTEQLNEIKCTVDLTVTKLSS